MLQQMVNIYTAGLYNVMKYNVCDLTDKFRHWINLCETAEHAEYTEGNATHQPDVLSLLIIWDFMPLLSASISFLHPTLYTSVPVRLSLIACALIFHSFQSTFLIWTVIMNLSHSVVCRVQLKCDGTRWRTGGEVERKLANGVGSQYSSHCLGTWCIQHYYHYYRWCAQLGCQ